MAFRRTGLTQSMKHAISGRRYCQQFRTCRTAFFLVDVTERRI